MWALLTVSPACADAGLVLRTVGVWPDEYSNEQVGASQLALHMCNNVVFNCRQDDAMFSKCALHMCNNVAIKCA